MEKPKKNEHDQSGRSGPGDPHIPGAFPQEESDSTSASAAPLPPRAISNPFRNLPTRTAAAPLGSQSHHPAYAQVAGGDGDSGMTAHYGVSSTINDRIIEYPSSMLAHPRSAGLAERAGEVARTRRRDREDQREWYRWAPPLQPFGTTNNGTMHDGNNAYGLYRSDPITNDGPLLQDRSGYRTDFTGNPARRYGFQPARPPHHYRRNAAVQINGVWTPPPPNHGNYEAQEADPNGNGMFDLFPAPDGNHVYPRVPPLALLSPISHQEQMRFYRTAMAAGTRGPPPTANAFAEAYGTGGVERPRLRDGADIGAAPDDGLFQQAPPYVRSYVPQEQRPDRGRRCDICLSDAIQIHTASVPAGTACDDNDDDRVSLVPDLCYFHDVCESCLKVFFEQALKAEIDYPPQACCHLGAILLKTHPDADRFLRLFGEDFVQRYREKEKEYKTPHKHRTYCANVQCGLFIARLSKRDEFPTIEEILQIVPHKGIEVRDVVRHFQRRIGDEEQRLLHLLRNYVRHDGDRLHVLFPEELERGIGAPATRPPDAIVACSKCTAATCTKCKQLVEEDQQHECTPEADANPDLGYSDKNRCKKCPECGTLYYLSEGCNHVDCRACKHSFCFVCLQAWSGRCGCPNYFDAPGGYDAEGYEVWRGIHRDTGRNREGYNLDGRDVDDRRRRGGALPRPPMPTARRLEGYQREFDGLPYENDIDNTIDQEYRRQVVEIARQRAAREASAGAERQQSLFGSSSRVFQPDNAAGARSHGLGSAVMRAGERARERMRTTFASTASLEPLPAGPQPRLFGGPQGELFSEPTTQTNAYGDPVPVLPQNAPATARRVRPFDTARRDFVQRNPGVLRDIPETRHALAETHRDRAGFEEDWASNPLFGPRSARSITAGPGADRVAGERAPAPMFIARGGNEGLNLQPREIEEDRMAWEIYRRARAASE